MELITIFILLTVFAVIQLLYSLHVIDIIRNAIEFLTQTRNTFLGHQYYDREAKAAIADLSILVGYKDNLGSYLIIIIIAFIMNMIGFASAIDILFNGVTYGLSWLHGILAFGNGLIMMNAYNMWKRKRQINAVCMGYNVILRSIRYIEVEPKENQKDG